MRDCPTSPLHSIANTFECKGWGGARSSQFKGDEAEAAPPVSPPLEATLCFTFKCMLTCVIYADVIHIPAMQAAGYWRAAHHWDEHSICTLNGTAFAPEQHGVLDRGYVAAGKMGGNADNDSMGRRVFFGWNMPWSRQGAYLHEVPWRRRRCG